MPRAMRRQDNLVPCFQHLRACLARLPQPSTIQYLLPFLGGSESLEEPSIAELSPLELCSLGTRRRFIVLSISLVGVWVLNAAGAPE